MARSLAAIEKLATPGRSRSVGGRRREGEARENRVQLGSTDKPMPGGMGAGGDAEMGRFLARCSPRPSAAHAPRCPQALARAGRPRIMFMYSNSTESAQHP